MIDRSIDDEDVVRDVEHNGDMREITTRNEQRTTAMEEEKKNV